MNRSYPESWTGDIVRLMHLHRITNDDIANEMGYSYGYVSMILNGSRTIPDAQEKISNAVNAIIKRKTASPV